MTHQFYVEAYVDQASAMIGLQIDPAHWPGVIAYFRMISGIAGAVNDFPLDADIEIAPVFTPCSVPTPE